MTLFERWGLYLRLGAFTRRSFERNANQLLAYHHDGKTLSADLKRFFESHAFLEYWTYEFKHFWIATAPHGRIDLGFYNRSDALLAFARVQPEARIFMVDDVHHTILYRLPGEH